jgi:hypothetical protein
LELLRTTTGRGTLLEIRSRHQYVYKLYFSLRFDRYQSPSQLNQKAQCTSNSIKNGIFEALDLLNKAIIAIGGLDTVNRIKGITFEAPKLETPLHRNRTGLMPKQHFP